jgi:hypothetical protein
MTVQTPASLMNFLRGTGRLVIFDIVTMVTHSDPALKELMGGSVMK